MKFMRRLTLTRLGAAEQTAGMVSATSIPTRLPGLADNNALIGGFIITGTGPKRVIIRSIGPLKKQMFHLP